jgi:acetoacetate decarboxylase
MFTPIKLETRKNVARFKNMQVGDVREFGSYTKAQAVSMLRARMKKYVHEIYTLDTLSVPLKFRRDA